MFLFNYLIKLKLVILFFLSISISCLALANPMGGQVTSGNATITTTVPNTVQINQTSGKAIINWQSFNINNNEHTHFQQPQGGVALNRINPQQGVSQIYGRLTATGQIILINPAGIHFGPGAFVNVGGLIASTSGITDANFLAGKYVFDIPSEYQGSIINSGAIRVADYGLVAFLGNSVDNDGLINARYGTIVLASGNKFTLDFTGDGLINFAVTEGSSPGMDQNGQPLKHGVNNTGQLMADGGTILISAKNAASTMDHLINLEGVAQANTAIQKGGEIILLGDGEKSVRVAGKLLAKGEKGGKIKIASQHVEVDSTAIIDASGDKGGGEILIGGAKQGKLIGVNIPNAYITQIAKGAKINADTISAGDGGEIIIWSDGITQYAGALSARGGLLNGDGGFAEVSGKRLLSFQGTVDLLAPFGKTGTLLLDPENLTIQTSGPSTVLSSGSPISSYFAALDNSILTVSDLQNALANASVLVQTSSAGSQAGDITVANNVAWSNSNTLTLKAYRHVVINPGVSITNTGNGSLVLRADSTGTGSGTVTAGATAINVSGTGAVDIYYNPSSYTTPTSYTNAASSPATLTAYMLVNSMTNLSDIRTNLSGNYALSKTLDASSVSSFTPIGNNATPFTGRFNGNYQSIKNLTINTSSGLLPGITVDAVGLFGVTAGSAVIRNIALINATVSNTGLLAIGGIGSATGSLIGYAAGNTVVQNALVNGTVSYSNIVLGVASNVGGLIGFIDTNVNLNGVDSNAVVSSTAQVSAIVGAISNVGAIAGVNRGTIANAAAAGSLAINGLINVAGSIGGLVGTNTGTINTSYSVVSSITGTLTLITAKGGFIGANSGSLSNDYWNTTLLPTLSTCGSGTCTNAVARNTAQMRTQSTYVGFDFTNTWQINSTAHDQYPFLTVFSPRVISGVVPTTAGNVVLYQNGSLLSTQPIAAAAGTFSFSTEFGTIADQDALLLYTNGFSGHVANAVVLAPDNNASLTNINLATNNQLTLGSTIFSSLSNSTLAVAAGGLSSTDLLYSVASSNLTLGNASHTTLNLSTTTATPYTANGTIAYTSGGTGSLTFDAPLKVDAATITSTGTHAYNTTVTLGTNAALTGATMNFQDVQLGANTLTVNTTAANSLVSGVVSGSGGLTKTGSGTLTLSGANTYTGTTNINAGTLRLGGAGVLADNNAVVLANVSGASLDLNNFNETIGSLAGGGTTGGNVTLGSGTLTTGDDNTSTTFSGVTSGTGGLTKAGSGTFTLAGANTYTGATNINAGILRLGAAGALSDTTAVVLADVSGASLDLNNFNETIGSLAGGGTTGGNVTLGSGTLTTGGDNTSTTFEGVISGTGGLTKAGSGTFTLAGTNTYSGATNVNVGTVSVTNNAGLGSVAGGTTVADGATLNLNNVTVGAENLSLNGAGVGGNGALTGSGTSSLAGAIALNTDVIVGVPGTSLTLSGVISGGNDLTKVGSGILILSGANTYTGDTNINAGILRLGAAGVLSDTTAVVLADVSGASLDLNNFNETIGSLAGGGTTGGNVTLGSGTLTTGGDNTSTTFSGVVSGTGGLTKAGSGTFTLAGTNTYSGATNVNVGTVSVTNNAGLGSVAGGTTVADGATLNLNNVTVGAENLSLNGAGVGGNGALTGSGTSSLAGAIALNTDTTVGVPGTLLTLSGVISGGNDLTKVGSGILILSGANTYTGDTNINAGILRLGAAGVLSDTTAMVLADVSGASLDLNNFNETIGSLAGGGTTGGNVTLGSGTLTTGGNNSSTTFSGVASGTGGLTKAGSGTFTLAGTNTYSGATNVNVGTVSVTNNAGLGSVAGGTTVADGATLNLNNVTVGAENLSLNGAGVGGNGALTGSGTSSLAGAIALNTDVIIGVPGTSLTLSGVISGSNDLTKVGPGILILSGSNTYTGDTNINAGILRLGAAGVLSDTTTVVLANIAGASLDLNNFNETIGSLAGGGTTGGNMTLGSGTLTTGGDNTSTAFAGVVSGTGGLTKEGTGTFTLAGTNTYSGATTINAGILRLGAAGVLADSAAVVLANTAGASLDLNNFNETIGSLAGGGTTGGNVTLGPGILTTGGNNTSTTFAGVLSGTGDLIKVGTGTFTLAGTNTYSGTTNVDVGTVSITNNAGLGSVAGSTTVANGATLNLNNVSVGLENISLSGALTGSGTSSLAGAIALNADTTIGVPGISLTLNGVISGGNDLTKVGPGELILSGNNTYSGNTNVNAGVLSLQNENALGDTVATIVSTGATLQLDFDNATLANTNSMTLNGFGSANQGALINIGNNVTLDNDILLASNSSLTSTGILNFNNTISGNHNLQIEFSNNGIALPDIMLGNTNELVVNANGPITQNGAISGDTLTVSANNGIVLNNNNTLNQINFENNLSGNISLVNQGPLIIDGITQHAPGGNVNINNDGALTTTGTITTQGGHVTLATDSQNAFSPITINGNIITNGGDITGTVNNPDNLDNAIIVNGFLNTAGGIGQGTYTIDNTVVVNREPFIGGGSLTLRSLGGSSIPVNPPINPTANPTFTNNILSFNANLSTIVRSQILNENDNSTLETVGGNLVSNLVKANATVNALNFLSSQLRNTVESTLQSNLFTPINIFNQVSKAIPLFNYLQNRASEFAEMESSLIEDIRPESIWNLAMLLLAAFIIYQSRRPLPPLMPFYRSLLVAARRNEREEPQEKMLLPSNKPKVYFNFINIDNDYEYNSRNILSANHLVQTNNLVLINAFKFNNQNADEVQFYYYFIMIPTTLTLKYHKQKNKYVVLS